MASNSIFDSFTNYPSLLRGRSLVSILGLMQYKCSDQYQLRIGNGIMAGTQANITQLSVYVKMLE